MDQDVFAVFREVADRSASEREEYYSRRRVPAAVREEVESLLPFDRTSEHFLTGMVASAAETTLSAGAGIAEGARCGRYRLLRLIGRGGMGAVYEAEQDSPRRIVALKVIKPGLASEELARRFSQESQALGRLQHPGIAQIYESGALDTEFGSQPYFAMEFIRGEPLDRYTESHGLDTRQRLELMARVCEAVHHAHQRGIIHRDLKPGNILVDETGQPKILDFGVARVTDGDTRTTRQTDVGQLVGTLAYMSPEQVLADPLELDTRSDVYSLGAILYELLGKRLPYNTQGQLHEAVLAISQKDPPSLATLNRAYRGDIETIVGKALEKDKARRYASAAALAADIRRYLADEPITARPPSTGYQLRKFARRHRALVAGVAAVFLVLVSGIVASTWQAVRADRAGRAALAERDRAAAAEQAAGKERDRALSAEQAATNERNKALAAETQAIQERNRAVTEKRRADDEAATAKAVSDFLQGDLLAQASANTQAGPGTKPDPDLKVRTALDRAAARIAGKFAKQPLVEAAIRQTIGNTYRELGLYPEAQGQLEGARALLARVQGDEHPDTLTAMDGLGLVYFDEGKYTQAEALHSKVLEIRRRVLGEEHPDTLASMGNLAVTYPREGKYAQAEVLYAKVLEVQSRVLGEEHTGTLINMNNLALTYSYEGKYSQAEALRVKVLEIQRRVLGEEHPETLTSASNLAVLYLDEGKYAQAEAVNGKVLEIQRRVLGEEHPGTLTSMNVLASVYDNEGKFALAETLRTKVVEIRRHVLGEEHAATLNSMHNLASTYSHEGKYTQAEALYARVLEVKRRVLGEEHPDTLFSMNNLAFVYDNEGKYAEAETLRAKVLEMERRVLGEEHATTLTTMQGLAVLYRRAGKYAQSEQLDMKVLEIRRRVLGPQHPGTTDAMASLSELWLLEHRYAESEPLLREALNTLQQTSPDGWKRYYLQSLLGAALTGQKRYTDAEPLLLSGYAGMIQRKATMRADSKSNLTQAGEWILQLYWDWGQPDKAAEWEAKLEREKAMTTTPLK
jgi:tetratricopeptide (TPR) repeat protein/tRNA A-37 threonylcarbamoyl transferase component Bud32